MIVPKYRWQWNPHLWWKYLVPVRSSFSNGTEWFLWSIRRNGGWVFPARWSWHPAQWWKYLIPMNQKWAMRHKWLFWTRQYWGDEIKSKSSATPSGHDGGSGSGAGSEGVPHE